MVPSTTILIAIILGTIILIPLSFFYLIPFFFGAPFEKSSKKAIKTIVEFSEGSKHAAELGSGKGDIAIALAKTGKKVDCFEINPFLVFYTKKRIKKLKLQNKINVKWANFFKQNLSKYDLIVFFQFPNITKKLEKKLKKELTKESKIISNYWEFQNTPLIKQKNKVFLYKN